MSTAHAAAPERTIFYQVSITNDAATIIWTTPTYDLACQTLGEYLAYYQARGDVIRGYAIEEKPRH